MRELRVRVERRGYRTRVIDVVTTLLEAEVYTRDEITGLYRRRWEAGTRHDADPLRISLKGTIQHLATISPHMADAPARGHRRLYDELLRLLAREIVPDRPDRVEPRVRRRRPKNYPLMTRPRHVLKGNSSNENLP